MSAALKPCGCFVSRQTALRWLLTGTGPLTSPGCENGAFYKTSADKAASDLQVNYARRAWAGGTRLLFTCTGLTHHSLVLVLVPPSPNVVHRAVQVYACGGGRVRSECLELARVIAIADGRSATLPSARPRVLSYDLCRGDRRLPTA